MTDIEKLEMAVGEKIELWNISDLDTLSLKENSELLQLLKKPEVITECVRRSQKNQDLLDVFIPLSVKALLTVAQQDSNKLLEKFDKKEIDSDQLLFECNEFLLNKDKTIYRRLIGYLMIIKIFPEVNLLEKEIKIKEDIAALKEVICVLTDKHLIECYELILDLLDLIFPLKYEYLKKYNIDILDDEDHRLETTLDEIHAFELALAKSTQDIVEMNQNKMSEEETHE